MNSPSGNPRPSGRGGCQYAQQPQRRQHGDCDHGRLPREFQDDPRNDDHQQYEYQEKYDSRRRRRRPGPQERRGSGRVGSDPAAGRRSRGEPYWPQFARPATPDYFQWKRGFRTVVISDRISVSLRSAHHYKIPTEFNSSYA